MIMVWTAVNVIVITEMVDLQLVCQRQTVILMINVVMYADGYITQIPLLKTITCLMAGISNQIQTYATQFIQG